MSISTELRRIVFIAVMAVVLIVVLLTLSWCGERERAAQARDDATMADTRTTSAVEAITEIGALNGRAGVSETQVQEAQDAIRQALPADRDRVARHRLCVLQHRPDCDRLFGAGPPDPDPRDPSR